MIDDRDLTTAKLAWEEEDDMDVSVQHVRLQQVVDSKGYISKNTTGLQEVIRVTMDCSVLAFPSLQALVGGVVARGESVSYGKVLDRWAHNDTQKVEPLVY